MSKDFDSRCLSSELLHSGVGFEVHKFMCFIITHFCSGHKRINTENKALIHKTRFPLVSYFTLQSTYIILLRSPCQMVKPL